MRDYLRSSGFVANARHEQFKTTALITFLFHQRDLPESEREYLIDEQLRLLTEVKDDGSRFRQHRRARMRQHIIRELELQLESYREPLKEQFLKRLEDVKANML